MLQNAASHKITKCTPMHMKHTGKYGIVEWNERGDRMVAVVETNKLFLGNT